MKLLLDSVILIDHFNFIEEASLFLAKHQNEELYISAITSAEVLTGFKRQEDLSLVKRFLDNFKIINITKAEADTAAELRQKHKWKLPDALQAAAAINHKLKLVTRNTKDFKPSKHKFVLLPYKI